MDKTHKHVTEIKINGNNLYAHKADVVYKMYQFLQRHNLPKFTEARNNLNKPISIK